MRHKNNRSILRMLLLPHFSSGTNCCSADDCAIVYLDDLEDIACEKGGVRVLLDEKWRKVYKAIAPRGVFAAAEVHAA